MPDTIWIDKDDELGRVADELRQAPWIGIDTEFMREKTFFPKLCLLQISAPAQIWCVDTLKIASLAPLMPAFTAGPVTKILHAARQDLEAIYLVTRNLVGPVFDTQIAAACIGMKPQLGYADLAKTLLNVSIAKSQTRTDWSRRPLSEAQLLYAAEDVRHLDEIATRLQNRLQALKREHWVAEDCGQLANAKLYDLDPERAWTRLKGVALLAPRAAAIAKALAIWRERIARERDSPRSWILSDTAIFNLALSDPRNADQMQAAAPETANFPASAAASLIETIRQSGTGSRDADADFVAPDLRPTPEQKALINRLSLIVDQRASELTVSSEILATRGELKAMVMSGAETAALRGWRRAEIGERLLAELNK
jgi:ribonuclease D